MAEKFEMNELFESMDIDQEQKVALTEAFETAVLKKTTEMLDEHVETLVNEKVEVLEEEYQEKVSLLEDSLDGYLDTVVEEFVAENAPSYEAQINEEKVKTLLEMFDNMTKVVGIDMLTINEAKELKESEDYDNSPLVVAEKEVQTLSDKVADMADKLVESRREADKFLKSGIIMESQEGLSVLEMAKFEKLAEMVTFERTADYVTKLETIKESILDARGEDFEEKETKLPGNAFKQPEAVNPEVAMDYSQYI